jgi:RHS repeat-associated protein
MQSYITPDGTTRQMKLCYGNIPIAPAFNVPGIVDLTGYNAPELVTVVLADGTRWTFDYDNYGEATFVGLPTGGSITYTWTTIAFPSCAIPDGGLSRAVASRTLNDNNGHTSVWNYSWGSVVNGVISNTVTDPLNNDTVHVFTALDGTGAGDCGFYETRTQQYQGTGGSRQLQKQVDTTFSKAFYGIEAFWGSGMGSVVPASIQTTIYPSGKVSLVQKTYAPPTVAGGPISGDVATEKEYDWGPGVPGALLRETDTTYQWQVNSNYAAANMLDLPASVVVKDGGGNRVAETDYSYDEPAYLTTPTPAITTQHVAPPYGVRGNQTTASRWLNTTNSFVSSHTKWYDTGEVYKAIDPLGHETTHSYDPAYVGAYSTQTCSPQTGATTHCVSGTYDFNTGVLTSLTNENATAQASGNTQGDSAHTSNYVTDFQWRLTSAQTPPDPANGGARAQTILNFSAPNAFPVTVQRTRSITNTLTDSATNFFDGLGRGYKGQHVLSNGTATVDTTFDLAGHPATVTNPYFTTADATYGITTNQYDGLDRVTQTTKQDGSIAKVAYNMVTGAHDAVPGANTIGDCRDITDEAGKKRRACADALGRLVMVIEPNPGAAATVSTGSIGITGTLKSQPGVGAIGSSTATAQVVVGGSQHLQTTFPPPCDPGIVCDDQPQNYFDNGKVYITINGHEYDYFFPQLTSGDDSYTVALGLKNVIQADPARLVNASLVPNTTTIALTAISAGAAGNNISLVTGYTWDTSTWSTPSFTASPASGHLAGGADSDPGVTVYDAGTVTVTVNSNPAFTASASYGASPGNSTPALIASALAGTGPTGLNRSGSPVSATANGSSVTITFVSPGSAGDIPVSVTSNSTQTAFTFSPWSFTGSGTTLGSGYDASDIDNNPYKTLYTYDALGNLVCVEQHGSAITGTGCSAAPTSDASSPWRVRRFTYDSLSRLLTAKNPESGTITYLYDADGELLQKTSPAPNQTGTATQTVSYCYDALHRVTGRGYGAQSCPLTTPVVTYAYDSGANAKGHLTSMTDQAGTATYGYDILSRLITETRTLIGANNAAVSKSISYSYNLDGSVKTLTYPSNKVITYTPDSAGRMLSAVDSASGINYVTGATYGPDSALTGFISGNSGTFAGITNVFSYNKRLQPLNMSATSPTQTVYSIGYDFHAGNGTAGTGTDNGNVWGIANYKDTTHGRDQTFTYDPLNRLSSAQNAGTDCNVTILGGKKKFWGNAYGYDAWDNLLSKSVTKCSAESLTVTADAQNRIHASGTDYQYDAAGNMTFNATPPTQTYTYDQENRLTGAAGYTYTYDGDGNRVRKSNGNLAANGTLYWEMTPGVVAETDLAGTTKSEYVFFDGERVARRDGPTGTGGVFYYFSDHLKTASVITDSAGVIKAESDYYPWGGELQFVNNDPNDYKFTGKKNDLETGLYYFGARYYSNGLGRWVSADWSATPVPVPYASFGDPQTLNLYGFVGGNPASKADADGHCVWDLCIGETVVVITAGEVLAYAGAGAAIGAAGGWITKHWEGVKDALREAAPGASMSDLPHPVGAVNQLKLQEEQEAQEQKGKDQGNAQQSNGQQSNTQSSGNLPKPPRGKGSVPKDQRDPKRTATDKEKAKMREEQKGNCAQCDKPLGDEKGEAHHTPDRHADGGKEMKLVHEKCHDDLHSCN